MEEPCEIIAKAIANVIRECIFEHIAQMLKMSFKKIYLKHFITGQLLWQFKFFHMANSWQYYTSFSVPLHFYINMNFQKQI